MRKLTISNGKNQKKFESLTAFCYHCKAILNSFKFKKMTQNCNTLCINYKLTKSIDDLPLEIISKVFKYLELVDLEACAKVCIKWKLATEITGFHLGLHIPFESNFSFQRLQKFTNLVHLELDALFLSQKRATHIKHEKLKNLVITHHESGHLKINCPSLTRFTYGGILHKYTFTHTKQIKILEVRELHRSLVRFKNIEFLKVHNFKDITRRFSLEFSKLTEFHSEFLMGPRFPNSNKLITRESLRKTIRIFLRSLPRNCSFTLNKVSITEVNLMKLDLGKSDPENWWNIRKLFDQNINKPLLNPKTHFCFYCNQLKERTAV